MLRRIRPPEETGRSSILHQFFEAQVDTRPEAIAIMVEGRRITYAEIEQRANRLARYLYDHGVGRGSLVAILLSRSLDAYVSILGTLKAGAAYVPLDPEYPADRISYILGDSHAETLLTTAALASHHREFHGNIIAVDVDADAISSETSTRLPTDEVRVGPDDLCYVIYTSGSTGRPKGVLVGHRSVCNLVEAEAEIFRVTPEDRVCQIASLSFDLSVEEIWLAFQAGACLVPATRELAHGGPDLSKFLVEHQVTVLSCVPTLLNMLDEEIPTLHLVILGGEVCPENLVSRWARSGRRLVNTYGPTETTVTATYSDLTPGKPVTIGRPLPGYHVRILDGTLRPVPEGATGEICIGGIGVARGYVGRPKETMARFIQDPFVQKGEVETRLYRTGDLGRFDAEGNLEFLGRSDSQVKLRGFRIELSEIESVLMEEASVLSAACAVREDASGLKQLVGYVVARDGASIDPDRLRLHLRGRLPAYMVPAFIETVTALPRLPSGKLDRASLPKPALLAPNRLDLKLPRNETESRILEAWNTLFHPQPVSVEDDFFLDLGGHSLLAARMVSELRKDPLYSHVSVADVYENPTISTLAAKIDKSSLSRTVSRTETALDNRLAHAETKGNLGAGIVQTLLLYFVFGFRALEWMTPYLVFFYLQLTGHSILSSAAWAVAGAVIIFPVLLVATVAAKWLVIGKVKAGRYPLWSGYYIRWWFVQSLVSSIPIDYLEGTPLLPFVYRLFGVHVGRNVQLATENIAAFDQVTIGDGSCIDDDASLLGYTVKQAQLIIGPIRIGQNCFVGTRSVLSEETEMEDNARLEDLSLLQPGSRIPTGESWSGSPARKVSRPDVWRTDRPRSGLIRRALTPVIYIGLVLILPILLLAAILPGVLVLVQMNPLAHPFYYAAAVPLVGATFSILIMLEVVVAKWLLVQRVKPGTYRVHGSFYIRNWLVEQLYALSLDLTAQLRATLYLAPWFKALGAKLGRNVELSTAATPTPDLLTIEEGATIADEVDLGPSRVENGWMTIAPTKIGKRAFVGNSAVVPAGTTIGENSLLGVLTLPPQDPSQASEPGGSWLGNPPVQLPHREPSTSFSEKRTYQPTRRARLVRAVVEAFRVTLPSAGFIIVTTTVISATLALMARLGLVKALLLLPVTYGVACTFVALAVVVAKWLVMGRFRPFTHPLYTTYVWRLEAVNALYEFLATPLALDALQGTPLLPLYFRLLGAKVGKSVYVHTTGLIEFDLVRIGDHCCINQDSVLQTHLFEDRVLKASNLTVGDWCDIGAYSIVLYDSQMEDRSHLDSLSLLMKGETLPADTAWAGIPARRSD
ncbi:amino acid adenylation domain-containing protein [Candidatus Bathyarchaeota archaeon]|nr:MAG: amino acid adenylation domain-containing protein [Candidatus Bathyarchaeota archaeon]